VTGQTSSSTCAADVVDPGVFRAGLLSRLGLPSDAGPGEVAAARAAVATVLEHAPRSQQGWAQGQLADVDAVVSLLGELDGASGVDGAQPRTGATSTVTTAPRGRRLAWVVAGVVLVAGVALGGYLLGGSGGVPPISGAADSQSASATTPLDTAKVSALMTKIAADPKDVASLLGLSDLYFQSGDYATAATWSEKVLALEPENETALVALGAAQFNQGDVANAEKQWLQAVAVNPKNVEAHYDLGFLYLSKNPPDTAKVRSEWNAVIAIDPGSEIAKTVATHLQSLDSPSPTASGGTGN
jgi:tetratricopeptide (TPR) repeat protein